MRWKFPFIFWVVAVVTRQSWAEPLWVYTQSDLLVDFVTTGGTDWSDSIVSLSADGRILAVGRRCDPFLACQATTATNLYVNAQGSTYKLISNLTFDGGQAALSASGSVVAVGQGANSAALWTVRVFDGTNGTWAQLGSDLSGEGSSSQPISVAVSADGSTVACAASIGGTSPTVTAWVFAYTDGDWVQQGPTLRRVGQGVLGQTLVPVALSAGGETLAVGDPSRCRASVFTRTGAVWAQQDIALECSQSAPDGVGTAVALSGSGATLAVSSRQGAWVFTRVGGVWGQQSVKLGASAEAVHSVALSSDGTTLALGKPNVRSVTGWSEGAALLFYFIDGVWAQQGPMLVGGIPDGEESESYHSQAYSVALSSNGSTLAVSLQMAYYRARAFVFRRQGLASAPCESDVTCVSNTCFAGRCLNASRPGGSCASNAACLSRSCVNSTCVCATGCYAVPCGGCEMSDVCDVSGRCVPSPVPPPRAPNLDVGRPSATPVTPPAANVERSPGPGGTNDKLVVGLAAGGLGLVLIAGAGLLLWWRRRRTHGAALAKSEDADDSDRQALSASIVAPPSLLNKSSLSSPALSTSSWTQRECGASKDDRKAFLLRQLRHVHRTKQTLLGAYQLLGDGAYYQRVGGQGVVQFACIAGDRTRQVALKFFLDAPSFSTERAHLMNAALQHVMPPIHAIEANEDGALELLGRPLPPFVVTERGESLDSWLQRADVTSADLFFSNAVNIVTHLVQRVGELHAVGLVHRDLKPQNAIWLPSRREFTVIDFGSAAKTGSTAPMSISLPYAAPETVRAWADKQPTVVADPAVDVWALGLIAFELLTNTPNFSHSRDLVVQTMRGKLKLPWEAAGFDGKCLGFARGVVLSMLARDASSRPTLREVHLALTALLK